MLHKETHNTEFKSVWKDEYLKHICGFANANGGKLFVGVDDNGNVIGLKNTDKLLEDIPNKIVSILGITTDVKQLSHGKLFYLLIEIEPSSVPISFKGKYYIRSGTTSQELKGHELRSFILLKDNITWDEIIIPNATINDLDKNIVTWFVKTSIDKNRMTSHANQDDIIHVLSNLDLITDKNELTRAAVLLFAKRPQKYVRSATVKIGRFGDSDTDLISQDIIEGNLLEMADRVMELLRIKYLRSNISYQGMKRIESLEYPENVLREVIHPVR